MSYFHRPDTALDDGGEPAATTRSPLADFGDRVARWFAGPDRQPVADLELDGDPVYELAAGPDAEDASRFPLARLGYSRAAVDWQLTELERELEELRARHQPPISIT
jgi:hypothetical protein